ncbi:uncharacterized protein SPSK_09503 [Sporothrix schenckii 1099-18]|uniref:Uncharacterized protein n=1 Tax=Sporothrix schenckii 1099-18 TaxID=1397361 RepID=A0A0F2M9K8_SPOSC|nr:uncharacterized protein SPSK_09503 [Sporothrix schenckii 1099-18]KJR84846.1 hypothetical protein SPSK_09503 [Sporothrix schenckii 1099-18]
MGFGDLFRSSKGPKRPSSFRMPTDCVPSSSSASRPHTSASSKLGRRGAIKSDHSSSGHCAGRIQNTLWVRPGTGYRQVQPADMASGIPPAHIPMPSSSSHRPRVSPRGPRQPDPLLAGNEAYPVDLSSVSGGFGVPFASTKPVPVSHVPVHTPTYVDYHAPAPTPAYVYGPLPPVPLSRSSGHHPRTSTGSSSYASSGYPSSSSSYYSSSNTSYPPSSHTSSSRSQASSSHRPSHKHHSKREAQYEPERDTYEVSPLDAAFPPEVQRVLDRGFSSAASHGVSRNVSRVSTRGPSRNPSTAASSSSHSFAARAAEAQFAFDIGGYGPHTNHFVSPRYQPSYTSNSTGAYYNERGLF